MVTSLAGEGFTKDEVPAEASVEDPEVAKETKKDKKSSAKPKKKGKEDEKSPEGLEQERLEEEKNRKASSVTVDPSCNLFGVCFFPLGDIFRGALSITLTSPVLPLFPRRSAQLRHFQLRRNPYSQGTHMVLKLRLNRCLNGPLPTAIKFRFTRIFYSIPYDDADTYKAILASVHTANASVLGISGEHVRSTLATTRLTPEQRMLMAEKDVLTGWHVCDSQYRMILVEGLAPHNENACAIRNLMEAVPLRETNRPEFMIIQNEEITFQERLYMAFDLDLKNIKLMTNFSKVAETNDIYFNKNISPSCYDAFLKISQLLLCGRLKTAKMLKTFPVYAELLALEKRFGGFVSDEDMDGVATSIKRLKKGEVALGKSSVMLVERDPLDSESEDEGYKPPVVAARVDNKNAEYLEASKEAQRRRNSRSYIRLNQVVEKNAPKARAHNPEPDIWQRLNKELPQEIDWERMRVLEKRHRQAVEQRKLQLEQENGFCMPNRREFWSNPQQPHPARLEDVKFPYQQRHAAAGNRDFVVYEREKDFSLFPAHNSEFGYPGNAEGWGRSIFGAAGMTQDELIEIENQKKKLEKETWMKKVVVKDLTFHVNCNQSKQTDLNKARPLLQDLPNRPGLTYKKRMARSGKWLGPMVDIPRPIMEPINLHEAQKLLTRDYLHNPAMHPVEYRHSFRAPRREVLVKRSIIPLNADERALMQTLKYDTYPALEKGAAPDWNQATPSFNYNDNFSF